MQKIKSPFDIFQGWLEEASRLEIEANAMTLSSVNLAGQPSSRIVLFKGFHNRKFVFYTNTESSKGRQLCENPSVSICFHWKSLRRQVRVQGRAALIDNLTADNYFATRDRDSQIGAWASAQSRNLESRETLEILIKKFKKKFGKGKIPRPDYWSGFQVKPVNFEFWEEMPHRLHKRTFYDLDQQDRWTKKLLFP